MNSLRVVISALLNASQRSEIVVGTGLGPNCLEDLG